MHRHPAPTPTFGLACLSFLVSLSPSASLPPRPAHAYGSDARHARARDYPQSTRPNKKWSVPTHREREGRQKVLRTAGQLGRAQRVARWGHVWAQRSAACKGWPTIAPCGQGSGGRASAYRLEHTHAGLLARIPVQRHTVGPVGRLVEPNELMVPATCGGTAFEACSDSQTTGTLHPRSEGGSMGRTARHT